MRLGYIAIDQYGHSERLTDVKRGPRVQLLEKLCAKGARKIYRDPDARHVGYIVQGRWFDIFEVHEWMGGR